MTPAINFTRLYLFSQSVLNCGPVHFCSILPGCCREICPFLQSLLNCSWFVTKLPKKLPSSKKKASQPWTGYLVIFFGWREKNCGKIGCHVEFTVTYVFDQAWPCWELPLLGKSSKSTFCISRKFFVENTKPFLCTIVWNFPASVQKGKLSFFVWANFSLFTLAKKELAIYHVLLPE